MSLVLADGGVGFREHPSPKGQGAAASPRSARGEPASSSRGHGAAQTGCRCDVTGLETAANGELCCVLCSSVACVSVSQLNFRFNRRKHGEVVLTHT